VPGSARVIASVGDEQNALLMLTVEADLGLGRVTRPAARHLTERFEMPTSSATGASSALMI
jgi:hypothetical protein